MLEVSIPKGRPIRYVPVGHHRKIRRTQLLAVVWEYVCEPPKAQTTNTGPWFDVGFVNEYAHRNIRLMESFAACEFAIRFTIDLQNFRKWESRLSKCRLYIARYPRAKHATANNNNIDLKYGKRFTMEAFLSCSIHRFIWNTFDAC